MPKKKSTSKKSWPIKMVLRKSTTTRGGGKKVKQYPPPIKPTKANLKKLVKKMRVHENPDPPPCEYCGLRYRNLKTGLDFQAVKDMLWVGSNDPDFWRHKGRHSVLGLWFEIKRNMWQDHIELCREMDAHERMKPEDIDPFDEAIARRAGYDDKIDVDWEGDAPF